MSMLQTTSRRPLKAVTGERCTSAVFVLQVAYLSDVEVASKSFLKGALCFYPKFLKKVHFVGL